MLCLLDFGCVAAKQHAWAPSYFAPYALVTCSLRTWFAVCGLVVVHRYVPKKESKVINSIRVWSYILRTHAHVLLPDSTNESWLLISHQDDTRRVAIDNIAFGRVGEVRSEPQSSKGMAALAKLLGLKVSRVKTLDYHLSSRPIMLREYVPLSLLADTWVALPVAPLNSCTNLNVDSRDPWSC